MSEKLISFVIGQSARPCCFKVLASTYVFACHLCINKKAWMISDLFQKWLDKLNSKMKVENQSILLLIDNCSTPNTTSKLQLCDVETIKNTKMHYLKLENAIVLWDEPRVDIPRSVNRDICGPQYIHKSDI